MSFRDYLAAACALGKMRLSFRRGPYWANNGFIWIDIAFFRNYVGNDAYIIIQAVPQPSENRR